MDRMKIYKVTVDNDPGGWKSGEDPSVLVLATNKEEAIQKVKSGWWKSIIWNGSAYVQTYGFGLAYGYFTNRTEFCVSEVEFLMDDYSIEVLDKKGIRKLKLDNINSEG